MTPLGCSSVDMRLWDRLFWDEAIPRLILPNEEENIIFHLIKMSDNPNVHKYHKRPVARNDKIHKVQSRHQAKV